MSVPRFRTVWERYRYHLVERGRRPKSLSVIRGVLYNFVGFLEAGRRPKPWERPTRHDLTRFLNQPPHGTGHPRQRADGRLADNTRASYASIVTCFYRWAYDQGILGRNPLRGFVLPRAARPVARALDLPDVQRALALAAERSDQRMTLMIWLMFGCGMRAMEVAGARVEHVRLQADPPLLEIPEGKGGKPRKVPLAPPVVGVLRRYLADLPGTGPLVTSKVNGQAIRPQTVSRLLANHLHAAGIADTGHSLRHTFATQLLQAGRGANLYAVSKALGHSSTQVTEHVYVASYLGDLAELARLLPDPRSNGHRARPEPAGLAALVPVDVRDQLAAAVATLERLGPEVTRALETLQRCTTRAWLATLGLSSPDELAGMRAGDLPDVRDEDWEACEQALRIDRGWELAYQLRDAVDD